VEPHNADDVEQVVNMARDINQHYKGLEEEEVN
jgi:hypothetical protein